jgi:PhnB protein
MAKAKRAVPEGLQTMTPQLVLDDAAAAIDWYKKAFGATEVGRNAGPDGKIIHAEMRIGTSTFYCNDPVMGHMGPKGLGGSPASFWLYVEDVDAVFTRAVDAGATIEAPLEDQFWGDRAGAVKDPAGYNWWIGTRKEDLTKEELNARAEAHFGKMAQPQ